MTSLRYLLGRIEFELAPKARIKDFIVKQLNIPIAAGSGIKPITLDMHPTNPFVSVLFWNSALSPARNGAFFTFDLSLNQ